MPAAIVMTPALRKMVDNIGSGGWENHCCMAFYNSGKFSVNMFLVLWFCTR
jgi:hypothetical protein